MSFNTQKFGAAKFAPRTDVVSVADSPLVEFFEGDSEPVFTVRGLTATELAIANEAQIKNAKIGVILDAITAGGQNAEQVKQIRESIGITNEKTPGQIAKGLEMVVMGCVEPEVPLNLAVKIAEVAPIEFNKLVIAITKLTGQGSEAQVKPKPSGRKKRSKAA
jgi:hypothetical protein